MNVRISLKVEKYIPVLIVEKNFINIREVLVNTVVINVSKIISINNNIRKF